MPVHFVSYSVARGHSHILMTVMSMQQHVLHIHLLRLTPPCHKFPLVTSHSCCRLSDLLPFHRALFHMTLCPSHCTVKCCPITLQDLFCTSLSSISRASFPLSPAVHLQLFPPPAVHLQLSIVCSIWTTGVFAPTSSFPSHLQYAKTGVLWCFCIL